MNARWRFGLVMAMLVALGSAAATGTANLGCGRGEPSRGDHGVAVDAPLMAFLSQARALHHEANVREAEGDIAGAIAALQRLVQAPRPPGALPEVDEVLADTFARLAELHSRINDVASAEKDIEQGLALAPARTYFRGHLFEVSGVVEETRAADLADAGKADEAAHARAKAVELLRQAVTIQEEVIRGALDDGGQKR